MSFIQLTRDISEKQLSWRNDPQVNKWTRQNGILSKTEHEGWLERIKKDHSIVMFGIQAEGKAVGTCGLTSISFVHGTAEFSLLIDPEQRQRGYGKASLIELLKYGFKHLRLNLIFGETFVSNPALKMFIDLGMKEEGMLRERYFKDGIYIDSIPVSIDSKEARAQKWWR